MEIYDSHIHSSFSADGQTSPREIIEQAVAHGVRGICFTDHMDPDFSHYGQELTFDPDRYFDVLLPLAASYASHITVRIGLEFGMQPHLIPVFEKLTENYPFDFVIGSQHLVFGEDPYDRTVFRSYSPEEAVRRYYEEMQENLRLFQVDTVAHPEYIFRYLPDPEGMTWSRFEDVISPVIRLIEERGTGLEINTSSTGTAAGIRDEIAARFIEDGGTCITAGSDAHRPEAVGSRFDAVHGILEKNGLRYYSFFTKRKAEKINI